MEQEYPRDTITIDPPELERLPLGKIHQPQNKAEKQHKDRGRPEKALLLAYGAEDEVGVLFRHELELCLRPVQESLALQPARSDGDLALVDIVTCPGKVFVKSQKHVDAHTLVGLHDIIQHIVCRIEECYRPQCEQCDIEVVGEACVHRVIDQIADDTRRQQQLHPDDIKRNDEL